MTREPHPGDPVPVKLHHVKLGDRVPLKSNSPTQWIAASGMILRAEVGSTAHGTAIAGVSDVDEMGVCIEPKSTTLGLGEFQHYRYRTAEPDGPATDGTSVPSRPDDLDLTVYALRRFVGLVAAGNPGLVALLFVPQPKFINAFGEELRANATKFLSTKVHASFKNYMRREVQGMLKKTDSSAKLAAHALRLGMQGCELLERGRITIPVRGRQLELLREVRVGVAGSPERVASLIKSFDQKLDLALEKSHLPDEPDWGWINVWLADVHLRHWKEA
jgi:predicted nucleotidyltransferase